jgi:hypothetical protein
MLDSGHYFYSDTGCLKKCWQGYKIGKGEWDTNKMEYYAKGIRKFKGN